MPAPDTPSTELDLLESVNGNAYNATTNPYGLAQGGHKTNWNPTMNAVSTVGSWLSALGSYLDGLATQVQEDAASAAAGSGTESTLANIWSGITAMYLSIRRVYAANVPVALTDGTTVNWDMATGINFELTLGGTGRTLANPTNQVAGKSGIIFITQDGMGGREITTFGDDYLWMGGEPAWPMTPGAETQITYFVKSDGNIRLTNGGSSAV